MKWAKDYLTLKERIKWIWRSIKWLSLAYLPCYLYDEKKWIIIHFSIWDRLECFLASIETAIIGYLYKAEESRVN